MPSIVALSEDHFRGLGAGTRTGGCQAPASRGSGAAELLLKGGPLVGAQPPDAAAPPRAPPLRDLPRPDLAHAGQRLDEGGDLDLADHVVGRALLDDLGDRCRAPLEAVLDVSALLAGDPGLGEGLGALLGREGRKCHGGFSFCRTALGLSVFLLTR